MVNLLRKIKILVNDMILFPVTYIPGSLGRKIRYFYWKRRLKRCGKNVIIDEGVLIQCPEWISIGDNVWIDKYCFLLAGKPRLDSSVRKFIIKKNIDFEYDWGELIIDDCVHIAPFSTIQAHGGVYIGKNTGIASGSRIYSLSHHYRNIGDENDKFEYKFTPMAPENEQFLISAPVVIKDNAAVGLNSVILPGTTINEGTWIGVCSYVAGKTEPKSIYSAEKAKFVKMKFE